MSKKAEGNLSLLDKAEGMSDVGDYAGAIKIYTQLIARCPVAEMYNARGNLLSTLNDHQNAVVDYTDAIGIDPTDPDYYVNRGNIYLRLKAFDLALEDYDKAIELNLESVYAYNGRGYVYGQIGRIDDAIEDYHHAINLDKSYISPRFNLGLLYYENEDYSAAIVHLDIALTIDPNDATTRSILDAAREALGSQ